MPADPTPPEPTPPPPAPAPLPVETVGPPAPSVHNIFVRWTVLNGTPRVQQFQAPTEITTYGQFYDAVDGAHVIDHQSDGARAVEVYVVETDTYLYQAPGHTFVRDKIRAGVHPITDEPI